MINLSRVKRALMMIGFAGVATVLAASSAPAFSGFGGHFGGGGGGFGGSHFGGSHFGGGGFGGGGLGGSHVSYGHPGRQGGWNGGTHHPTRGPIYGGNHRTPGHCEGERCGGRKPPQVGTHCWRDRGCKVPVRCEWSHSCRVPVTCRYNRYAYGCHWRPKYPPVIVQRPYYPTPTYTAAPSYSPTPSYTPAPAAYTPPTKVCTPTGTYLSIVFQDNASVADVTGFLKNYNVTMGDGPNADGVYRIKLPDGGTQEQIGQMIDSMRGQTNVVKSVAG